MVSFSDVYSAYIDCQRRKANKVSAKLFETNLIHNLASLVREMNSKTYRLSSANCFIVTYPSKREVFASNFRDRVLHHYWYERVNPIIEHHLIYDCSSCRTGKGTDFAIHRVERFIRQITENYQRNYGVWVLKTDYSGFFMSIIREKLYEELTEVIYAEYSGDDIDDVVYLTERFIVDDVTVGCTYKSPKSMWRDLPPNKTLFNDKGRGEPIGNLPSQATANFYMNLIDRIHRREKYKGKVYYSRYVDDIVVLSRDRNLLVDLLEDMKRESAERGLTINMKKTSIRNLEHGIRYLGKEIHPHYTVIQKRTIHKMYSDSQFYHDTPDLLSMVNSRLGQLSNYNGYRLAMKWFKFISPKLKSIALVQPRDKTPRAVNVRARYKKRKKTFSYYKKKVNKAGNDILISMMLG